MIVTQLTCQKCYSVKLFYGMKSLHVDLPTGNIHKKDFHFM